MWTARQREVLAAGLVIFCVVLGWRSWNNRVFVSNPLMDDGPRAGELADRLDPNVAEWSALALIPGVGAKRAKAIVAYREEFARVNAAGEVAYRTIDDLKHVKDGEDETGVSGIGEATAESMRGYLVFPGDGGK